MAASRTGTPRWGGRRIRREPDGNAPLRRVPVGTVIPAAFRHAVTFGSAKMPRARRPNPGPPRA